MAREVRVFAVTVPAGTPQAAPQVTPMSMPPREVQEIEVRIPPGPRGELGFRIGSSGVQLLPIQLGTWLVTDDEVIRWPLEGQHDSGSWEFTAYNTGIFPHTVGVRFLVGTIGSGAPQGQVPIPAGQLLADSGALPSLPPLGLPDLPPISLPPPPELPPLPELPPPPDISGLPGTVQAPAQPVYNWWSDAVSRLLTWPDQTSTTRFDEVFVNQAGQIVWYAWSGGAGMWQSYNQRAGSQGDGFVDASACFTLWQGVIRLNIVGTKPDGTRWIKVLNAQNFTLITDWVQQPAAQDRELAYSKRVQAG